MADDVPRLIRAAALSSLLIETLDELERRPLDDEQVQTLRDVSDRLAAELERSARARTRAQLVPRERDADARRANVIPLPSRP